MAGEAIKVMTGVGRLVQGHPLIPMPKTDRRTKAPKLDKDGKPMMQYLTVIAFPKSDPLFASAVYPVMQQVAVRDWPGGQFNKPTFAWKWFDADTTPDDSGKLYAARDGFAGCYVLKVSSSFPYPVVNAQGARIEDANQLKRGYWVRAYIGVKGNDSTDTPGLYINPDFVQLCGYDKEIHGGPDVAGVLAQVGGFALPAGVSATPVAAGAMMPALPGLPQQPMAPAAQPLPGYQHPMAQPQFQQPAMQPVYQQPAAQPMPMQPQFQQPAPQPVYAPPGTPMQPVGGFVPGPMQQPQGMPQIQPHAGILQPPR